MWQMLCIYIHFKIFTICFHFFFSFTPQPQRLIELVRVVTVEVEVGAWSWRSLWKCCTREKHCAVSKLSRS